MSEWDEIMGLSEADGINVMRAEILKLIDPGLSDMHDLYTVLQLAWIEITNQRKRIAELEDKRIAELEEAQQWISVEDG